MDRQAVLSVQVHSAVQIFREVAKDPLVGTAALALLLADLLVDLGLLLLVLLRLEGHLLLGDRSFLGGLFGGSPVVATRTGHRGQP